MGKANVIASASAQNKGAIYQTNLVSGSFHLTADEPVAYGGGATGPAPTDYLCMALASCKAITVRMYAARKGWNLEQVDVAVNVVKSSQATSGLPIFYCEVKLTGNLDEAQRKRILEIAGVCPVERLLGKQNEVVTTMVS
jgi:putative redox protein